MQLTFLGTSCMVPTKERNPSAIFISYKTEGLLFDCGEGTQRQMKLAGIPITKITKLLITHWHGDHILGLLGIIQTLGASNYEGTLEIYSPKGTRKLFENMCNGIVFDFRINCKFIELESGQFFEGKDFSLSCLPLDHKIPCIGYAFQELDKRKMDVAKLKKLGIPEGPLVGELQRNKTIEWKNKKVQPDDVSVVIKGRKVVFMTDTVLTDNCYKLAKDADVLISESSFASNLQEKAREYKHLTAKDAAMVASKSNVKKLYLTHFSARYKNTLEVEEDARTYFDNVFCAKDLMKVNL